MLLYQRFKFLDICFVIVGQWVLELWIFSCIVYVVWCKKEENYCICRRRISKITKMCIYVYVKEMKKKRCYRRNDTDRASNNGEEREGKNRGRGLNCPWRTRKSVKRNGADTVEITFRDRNWKLLVGMSAIS